jgi:hypothetical protein
LREAFRHVLPPAWFVLPYDRVRFLLVVVVAACGAGETCPLEAPLLPGEVPGLRVVTANVGNPLREPPAYALRVAESEHEAMLGASLRATGASIIALQEVLTAERCALLEESDPNATCFAWRDRQPQVRRLLGEDYAIACDAGGGTGCIAVRRDFGRIRGLADGAVAVHGAKSEPLPGPPCDFITGACSESGNGCDSESLVATVRVDTARGPLDVVLAHPTAEGRVCRTRQLAQAFGLAGDVPVLLLGDWNYDPDDPVALPESAVQAAYSERLRCHHPRGAECRLVPTRGPASLDRVFSDFARGTCRTTVFDAAWTGRRHTDHLGVECDLFDAR